MVYALFFNLVMLNYAIVQKQVTVKIWAIHSRVAFFA